MSSSLTVWSSSITKNIENKVAPIIKNSDNGATSYDSVNVNGCTETEIKEKISNAYDRLVTMTMPDICLHIVAVIPLFESNSDSQIKKLVEACNKVEHNISVHIFGLSKSLRHLFESEKENLSETEESQERAKATLKSLRGESTYNLSYSLIEDYAENGAPIRFTNNSLSRFLATIQIALMQNYYDVFPTSLTSAHNGSNLSIGLSTLSFKKDTFANELLRLGFLSALDRAGINETAVDAQKVANVAERFLRSLKDRYPNLFENSIYPLLRENELEEGEVVARSSAILDGNLETLKEEVLNILKDESLTLPEREAVLALILGRDNEQLRGVQYDAEGVIIDDVCSYALDLYIDAYNDDYTGTSRLPTKSEINSLNIAQQSNTYNNEKETENENAKAFNPLSDIKRLKKEIVNTTSFIRERTEELTNLQKSESLRSESNELKKRWKEPSGNLKDVEYPEQPLEDKYIPSNATKPKEAIDLRKFFAPVQNQYHIGACTSFAVASMYDAAMKRNGKQSRFPMSPAFLYYYSNILTGRPAGGSNFKEQLAVLGREGICQENLYHYDIKDLDRAPDEEALEDAKLHHVLKARQIELSKNGDVVINMKINHEMITHALSEGFPIGISLKIYDNFGKEGPFILHPSEKPEAKEDGWHAMVIVGYSEMNKFYIVRNSWGPDFGDQGYCYIPMAYIEDPYYMDFACIITETTDDNKDEQEAVPTELADFAGTENEIKIATIRNVLVGERITLDHLLKLYSEYYKYYQRLMLQLSNYRVQSEIRESAEAKKAQKFIDVSLTKQQLTENFVGNLKKYKKELIYSFLIIFGIALTCGLIWYFSKSTWVGIVALALTGFGILSWGAYKWRVKKRRRELQEELESVYLRAKKQEEEFLETKIRYHVAGMWINKFHNLSINLANVYERLGGFNETLRAWAREYSVSNIQESVDGQMFCMLDGSEHILDYFEANKELIIRGIDLHRVFEGFTAHEEDLDQSHQEMRTLTLRSIELLLNDFNIVKYLLGESYPFLSPIDMENVISTMLSVGMPTYRNHIRNAETPARILLAKVEQESEQDWDSKISTLFPLRPTKLYLSNPTILILITIKPQQE